METVAIIPARGGSKGIPGKNLIDLCGKPLLAWSIEHALGSKMIDSVWVSSDDEEILLTAEKYGATPIQRPEEFSSDHATSESVWIHAIEFIEMLSIKIDLVLGMQPTSPIRGPSDLDDALKKFKRDSLDSMFSGTALEDFYTWSKSKENQLIANDKNRARRQDLDKTYLENGSFYIFKPGNIIKHNNRLHGKIGVAELAKHKSFQIDDSEDVFICEAIINQILASSER